MVFILLGYIVRMVDLQLVNAEYYVAQATDINTRTTVIKAARGEIVDRYGRPLATTREGYNIVLNKAYLPSAGINGILTELIALMQSHSVKWTDTLPFGEAEPYQFTGSDSQLSSMRSRLKLEKDATAGDCLEALTSRYSLTEVEGPYRRAVMGIRYSMEAADFSLTNPFTLAEDIPAELMSVIEESGYAANGIEIQVGAVRCYTDSELAAHLLGTIGPIYAEDWEELKAKGYSYNDKVGKSGIEKAFEDQLKGVDGVMTYRVNRAGQVISSEVTQKPQNGRTVYLSIDKNLQSAAINAFKDIEPVLKSGKRTSTFSGGAAVAVDVKSGEVLMSVSYPTYPLDDYYTGYNELLKNKQKPLFNRALNGTYSPGSAYKPVVAVTALDTGNVTADEYVRCTGVYTYYKDYHPHCLHVHGNINLKNALSKSCNLFFFEMGRRCGITALNKYSRLFGLGESTGIELSESKGTLAGPDYSRSVGKIWTDGNTLAAAIGQSDNSFTPLQLACYVATVANGGTRYKATMVDRISEYDYSAVVYQHTPEVLNTVDVSQDIFGKVKEGMLSVTEDGTGQGAFKDYSVKVGGKTGTAESVGGAHGIFIAFAPYDDPQIAVSVVLEHGNSSATAAKTARKILDAYFFAKSDETPEQPTDTILP